MRRDIVQDLLSAAMLASLVLLWSLAVATNGCRASMPVQVKVYSCQTAIEGSHGVTLEQCRVVDDSEQPTDQTGDDAVDVHPSGGPSPGVELRAYGPPVAALDSQRKPRRKRRAARRVRVKGYTRRAPRRGRRRS